MKWRPRIWARAPYGALRESLGKPLDSFMCLLVYCYAFIGRKVAIDASMSIYQFLIAVRQDGGAVLTNEAGETTR